METKKYDKLRKKMKSKDFEGKNKGLDKWLWNFSFLGNISSIFFATFLVYPALLKAITLNLMTGMWGIALAIGLTLIFLTIFEIIKRYFIRNFSNDYVTNDRKVKFKTLSWLVISLVVVVLSFYLSISGSKNLASTSSIKNAIVQTEISSQTDSITAVYDVQKQIYIDDNEALEGIISWKTKGLIISVIKQFSEPYSFDFSDHLFVCYGYGGHFGYKYSDHYNSFFGRFNYQSKKISPIVGMDGYLGLEYRIYELPFIFGIDYKPFFEFSTRQYFRLQLGDVAFAVKYRF